MEVKNCLVCGNSMVKKGIGQACPNCGYICIPSPLEATIQKKAKNKKIMIILIVILVVWVIPYILMNFLA